MDTFRPSKFTAGRKKKKKRSREGKKLAGVGRNCGKREKNAGRGKSGGEEKKLREEKKVADNTLANLCFVPTSQ